MRIAGTLPFSLVNGEGVRFVVFLQGCAHHCPKCQNPDTWEFNLGTSISVEDLADEILRTISGKPYDGITLSGGDPVYQHDECVKLLERLHGINVWLYTGFEWEEVKDKPLIKMCDAVVAGPYVDELRCEGKMYGSSNQKIYYPKGETTV